MIAAQHTRAYVAGNKNDTNDAAAIAEARRASTKTVPINTEAQQDLQMLHRTRQALMHERTAMICRIRAFAGEYGQVFAVGVAKFQKGFVAWLADEKNGLSGSAIATFTELKAQLDDKDARIAVYDARLTQAAKEDPRATDMMDVPGVGKLIATGMIAAVADPHHFRNGRDFSANLGLVPREHSSGGKQRLFGITKRGDTHLRTLLIHGARSAQRVAQCGRETGQDAALGCETVRAQWLQGSSGGAGQQDGAGALGDIGTWSRLCSGLVEKHDQTGWITRVMF